MKDHGCLEHHHNCYFTRILFHFANSLRIILAFLEDHCDVGLQLILTWLVLLYYERIPKKQDGSCLIGRTPSFCGEYSQLFIHQVCAFLGYSNYKQFFLFKAFCFRNFSPTLEKSWLHPWHSPLKIVQATIILLPQKYQLVAVLFLLRGQRYPQANCDIGKFLPEELWRWPLVIKQISRFVTFLFTTMFAFSDLNLWSVSDLSASLEAGS